MAGQPWPEGTAQTFWGTVRCDSSWHGIRCWNLKGANQRFTLGDYEAIVETSGVRHVYH
jgi:hypothetical protein